MRFGAKEEKFNNMQSTLEKLIPGLSNATDQKQTTTLATNLFNSGVLKIGHVCRFVSINFLYNQNKMFTFKI